MKVVTRILVVIIVFEENWIEMCLCMKIVNNWLSCTTVKILLQLIFSYLIDLLLSFTKTFLVAQIESLPVPLFQYYLETHCWKLCRRCSRIEFYVFLKSFKYPTEC